MSYRTYDYILIADDQAGIRRMLFETLTDVGYNVEMAANGVETIQRVNARTPALILLDLKMPGMDGLETLNVLKKLVPNVPVVIISAYGEVVANLGLVQHYLNKPFDLDELRLLVKSILADGESRKEQGGENIVI